MWLTIIGCACSAPGPDSACSSYLISDDGYHLLLDHGPGASGTLQRYLNPGAVDAILLSHAHSDHIADVTQLWRLRIAESAPRLPIVGPSNLPPDWYEEEAFDIRRAAAGLVPGVPLNVRLAQVRHGTLECWAARIGDALCYTADTEPCDAIDELATGCRVLLSEAAGFDEDGPLSGHLTAGDAGRLAKRSGASLLILTHLRAWQDHTRLLSEAAGFAPCPVILATPGLRVAL